MDQGGVAEQGTHSELLEHDGVYKQLVVRQLTSGGSST
jgi:ABC-type multidrug transport system fused ATPase/permease subunit